MSYYDKSTAVVAIVYIIRSSDGSILIVGFVFGQENSFLTAGSRNSRNFLGFLWWFSEEQDLGA
jgi:hypothetical protein